MDRMAAPLARLIAIIAMVAMAPPLWAQDGPLPEAPPPVEAEAPPCPPPEASETPSPDSVILPTTGAVFSLPPIPGDETAPDCPPPGPPPPVRPPAPDIFGLSAVPVGARSLMAAWDRVREGPPLEGVQGPWMELVEQAPGLPDLDPLDMANRWVNWHVRFVEDAGPDVWASPSETMLRGWGDCEDLSIAKMGLLRLMGVADDDMFLVVLRERHRPVDHAVLAVRRGGRMWVLDNRTDKVLPAEAVTDYVPTVAYTGTFAWIYGAPAGLQFRVSSGR